MIIEKAFDISGNLDFLAPGKSISFSAPLNNLCHDITEILKQGNTRAARKLGTLLKSYLKKETNLVSHFNWQDKQDHYDRLILFGSKEFEITLMALIWPENTFSPVHYHQAWCVFGVYNGVLTETVYAPEGSYLAPKATRHYTGGACACDSSTTKYYHKLGNAGATPAISFHIYGVSPDNLHKVNCVVG